MKNVNNDLSFVIFDGSSYYVVDREDAKQILLEDKNSEVVFKDYDLDKCQDEADKLNEVLKKH